jgi:hypothetical protein
MVILSMMIFIYLAIGIVFGVTILFVSIYKDMLNDTLIELKCKRKYWRTFVSGSIQILTVIMAAIIWLPVMIKKAIDI